jgi:hypothetical protein
MAGGVGEKMATGRVCNNQAKRGDKTWKDFDWKGLKAAVVV